MILFDQPQDLFWSRSSTFWTAIQALAGSIYTLLVIPTLFFIYFQVRSATKAFQFDAVRRLQELIDDFRNDRSAMYQNCPLELAATSSQFAKTPPRRRGGRPYPNKDRPQTMTPAQIAVLQSLGDDMKGRMIRVIARLNDIGQLIEDGFIGKHIFLGKYHVLVIQCCHMVEMVRQEEEKKRGGNYGQRLLRMRNWAISYNDMCPKHRSVPIEITSGSGHDRRVVYESPRFSFLTRIAFSLRQIFGLY